MLLRNRPQPRNDKCRRFLLAPCRLSFPGMAPVAAPAYATSPPRGRRPRRRGRRGRVTRNRRDRARVTWSRRSRWNLSRDRSSATAHHSSGRDERRRSRRDRLRSGNRTDDGDDPVHGPAHPRPRGPAGSGRATPRTLGGKPGNVRAISGSPGALVEIFRALLTATRKASGAAWRIGPNPAPPPRRPETAQANRTVVRARTCASAAIAKPDLKSPAIDRDGRRRA